MALRDSKRDSAAAYLQPGEPVQAVIGAQTASQWLAALTGIFVFLGFNRYRILAFTPTRIVVLDAGKTSMKKARGVVMELPRSTQLGPGTGLWRQIPGNFVNIAVQGSSHTLRSYWVANGDSHWTLVKVSRSNTAYSAPSISINGNSVNIAVQGPHHSLWFYWAKNGSSTWHAEQVAPPGSVR